MTVWFGDFGIMFSDFLLKEAWHNQCHSLLLSLYHCPFESRFLLQFHDIVDDTVMVCIPIRTQCLEFWSDHIGCLYAAGSNLDCCCTSSHNQRLSSAGIFLFRNTWAALWLGRLCHRSYIYGIHCLPHFAW